MLNTSHREPNWIPFNAAGFRFETACDPESGGVVLHSLDTAMPETLMGYHRCMTSMTRAQARAYIAGLKIANQFEIEELRKAPVELKLRQLWALMTSAHLFEKDDRREVQARDEVRQRWARLYRVRGG